MFGLSLRSSRARAAAATAIVVGSLYVFPLLLDLPLVDPDEGLHAAIALEMVEQGDWVTPRLLGEPFLDKPILFFWAQAGALAVFGAHEAAVRLPGLVFGLLGAGATALIGRRLAGRRAGLLAGLFYATMALPLALHQAAVHDVALVPWTTLALLAFWNAARPPAASSPPGLKPRRNEDEGLEPRRGSRVIRWSVVAGLWLGLAVLTKGVVGVALVGLAHAAALLAFRRVRPVVVLGGGLALVVAAIVAAPWYLAMEQANGGYLHYFFVERHVLGYTTSTQIHGYRPWWYYLPIVAGGGFPWVAFLPLAAWIAVPAGKLGRTTPHRDAARYAWIWLVSSLLFLSAAGSKLVTYVLPAFPAVALLSAIAWDHALGRREDDAGVPPAPTLRAAVVLVASVGAAMAPLALFIAALRYGVPHGPTAWVAAAAATLAWTVGIAGGWRRGRLPALATVFGAMVVTAVVLLSSTMPRVAAVLSARDLARFLNAQAAMPSTTWVVGERIGSLVFYLDPGRRQGLTPDRLVHVEVNDVLRMAIPQADALVAVSAQHLAIVGRRLPLDRVANEQAGLYRVYSARALHAEIVEQRRRF